MYGFLRRPRWIGATIVVVAVAVVFVNLGLWQLRRHDERRLTNEVMSARVAQEPLPLEDLLAAAGEDASTLEYRRVVAGGHYLRDEEVLLRGQVHDGMPGFHVVTPLALSGGGAVLVDRGWVPLDMDDPPVAAAPPGGEVEVTGLLRLSQERAGFGPAEPPGRLSVVARVDVDRIDEQVIEDLVPVWIMRTGNGAAGLPVAPEPLAFDDPGPHLSYAFQWFAFAVIAVVGYAALVLKTARGPR